MEKTQRKPNWTEKEKLLLVEAVNQREDRLFSKFKGFASSGKKNNKLKEMAWEEVAATVNSRSDTYQRSVEEVRKQYANIKQRAKEKMDALRRPTTGGGPKPPSPTPPEMEVLNALEDRPSLFGLASGHDTEGVSVAVGVPVNEVTTSSCDNPVIVANSSAAMSSCNNLDNTNTSDGTMCGIFDFQMPVESVESVVTLDLPLPVSKSKTCKRRKTIEEQEILTLKAEQEKYIQETKKLKEETEFYRLQTVYLKMKIKSMASEM